SKLVTKATRLEAQREALATERGRAGAERRNTIESALRRIASETLAHFEDMRLTESALRNLTAQVRAALDSDRPPISRRERIETLRTIAEGEERANRAKAELVQANLR